MTEVSFYHLLRQPLENALPKLLERVVESRLRAVVVADTEEQVEALNNRLWTYDPGSFLPHGTARDGEAAEQPIFLTTEETNPNDAGVLVLVDGRMPGTVDSYNRCLDMFNGNDPDAVERARGRWKDYKAAGHSVTYWQQSDEGRWEKKG